MARAGSMVRAHDELWPRAPDGMGAGAVLALLAHALLIAGLTFAVNWRTRDPEMVSAELWASVPRAQAPEPAPAPEPTPLPTPAAAQPVPPSPPPKPVESAPPPPAPDIAIERAERARLEAERRKAEAQAVAAHQRELAEQKMEKARKLAIEKAQELAQAQEKAQAKAQEAAREKAEADKKKRQEQEAREANEKRIAQQREENLKRIMGEAGKATGNATGGSTRASSTLSDKEAKAYADRLAALIRSNTTYSGNPPDNYTTVVEVRTAAGGTIIGRRIIQKSGHPDWDEAVLRGIDRTSALPAPPDGKMPETIIIDFRLRE